MRDYFSSWLMRYSPSQKGRHTNWTASCVVVRPCDTLFQSLVDQGAGGIGMEVVLCLATHFW